jgi:hypothetical protein
MEGAEANQSPPPVIRIALIDMELRFVIAAVRCGMAVALYLSAPLASERARGQEGPKVEVGAPKLPAPRLVAPPKPPVIPDERIPISPKNDQDEPPKAPLLAGRGRGGEVETITIEGVESLAALGDRRATSRRFGVRLAAPNRLTKELVAALAAFPNVTYLECRGNSAVDDRALAFSEKLPQLHQLDLTGTRVSDVGLEKLVVAFPNLEYLSLEGTAITDDGLKHLPRLTRLRGLILNGTQVGDAGIAHLAGMPTIEQLWLDRTKVTDDVARQLAKLRLRGLSLRYTRISGKVFSGLGRQTDLRTIWADGTPLADDDTRHFSELSSLQVLSLMRTRVTDTGTAELAKLPNLQFCHLGDGKDVAQQIARVSSVEQFGMPAFRAPFGLRVLDD